MADKSASSHPPGASNAQKAMKVQMDIRNNADEVSSILGDLNKWEKKIAKKEKKKRKHENDDGDGEQAKRKRTDSSSESD